MEDSWRRPGFAEALKDTDDDHRRMTGAADKGSGVVLFRLGFGLFVGLGVAELIADESEVFCAAVIREQPEMANTMEA